MSAQASLATVSMAMSLPHLGARRLLPHISDNLFCLLYRVPLRRVGLRLDFRQWQRFALPGIEHGVAFEHGYLIA